MRRVRRALSGAGRGRYAQLPTPTLPDWQEVESQLFAMVPVPSQEEMTRMKRAYAQVESSTHSRFLDFARALRDAYRSLEPSDPGAE